MGLRSLLVLMRAVNKETSEIARGFGEIVEAADKAPRVGRTTTIGTGGGGGGTGTTGGGAAGGTGLSTAGAAIFPAFGGHGQPRTVEELDRVCKRTQIPVQDQATGQRRDRPGWVCPDGSTYFEPVRGPTISGRGTGGTFRTGRIQFEPVSTTGPAGGADVGRRRVPPGTKSIVSGLKRVEDQLVGLRSDLRRGDGGTDNRTRGEL